MTWLSSQFNAWSMPKSIKRTSYTAYIFCWCKAEDIFLLLKKNFKRIHQHGTLKAFIECKFKKNHGLKAWVWWRMKRHQAKITTMIFLLHEYDTECCSTIQGSLPFPNPLSALLNPLISQCMGWVCEHDSLQPRLVWRCLQREEGAPFSLLSISGSQARAGVGEGLDCSAREALGGWGELSVGGGST